MGSCLRTICPCMISKRPHRQHMVSFTEGENCTMNLTAQSGILPSTAVSHRTDSFEGPAMMNDEPRARQIKVLWGKGVFFSSCLLASCTLVLYSGRACLFHPMWWPLWRPLCATKRIKTRRFDSIAAFSPHQLVDARAFHGNSRVLATEYLGEWAYPATRTYILICHGSLGVFFFCHCRTHPIPLDGQGRAVDLK